MSFRVRAFLLQFALALAVFALALTSYVGLDSLNHARHRARLAYQQLQGMSELAAAANRYSEQIAEVLLIGDAQRPDFDNARKRIGEVFAKLRADTESELAFISDPKEREAERRKLARLDQMQRHFNEIDRVAEQIFALDRARQRDKAIALFLSEVENRCDAVLEQLIEQSIVEERMEVERVDTQADRFSRRTVIGTAAISLLLVAFIVGAGIAFIRAFFRPIDALSAGALAIERGDLEHRIQYAGKNEFGALATRFNQMAVELCRQRVMLRRAHAELEQKVAERTDELAAVNQRLTLVDRQRVRFLADVSHELRTPLTALRGEAEVTLRGRSKPEAAYRDALANIASQAASMGRLVDDLLFLARSESGELRFNFKRIALSRVLAEANREVGNLARLRNIRIETAPVDDGLTLVADERRLRQALVIVLDNALKYSDRETAVTVEVDEGDADIMINVRDRGPGINPSEVALVFERFHRTEAARAGTEDGSGLGLSIARWIIENHAGTIDASSVLGEGTTFRICLPAVR